MSSIKLAAAFSTCHFCILLETDFIPKCVYDLQITLKQTQIIVLWYLSFYGEVLLKYCNCCFEMYLNSIFVYSHSEILKSSVRGRL